MNLLQFYTLSSLDLDVARNISKASLDPTVMLLKYVGQHAAYLPARCQMNCSIPIWCHMCVEARSTCNRCCRSALDGDIARKVICDNKHPKYLTARLPQHGQGAGSTKKIKEVLCYFSSDKAGEKEKNALGGRFGMKLVRMYEGELEKMKSGTRDDDTFRRASL